MNYTLAHREAFERWIDSASGLKDLDATPMVVHMRSMDAKTRAKMGLILRSPVTQFSDLAEQLTATFLIGFAAGLYAGEEASKVTSLEELLGLRGADDDQ
jgi:hypothetical protein